MADNFLNRLYQNPRQPLDAASITRVDELGNGYDDWNNLIAPKYEEPQQTWGETALGVATAPARIATSLVESLSPYGADGWQVPPLVQEGANALTAVGDAYNYGMDQDEINSRALGMAGFMMGGGGLAARPAGGTGMFAGRLAKTADQEALARAERLAAEGADRRAIWDSTGWFQGPDSKWRFEIDDSRSFIKGGDAPASVSANKWGPTLGGAMHHPQLFAAYDDLGDVILRGQNSGGGSHTSGLLMDEVIGIDNALRGKAKDSVALHEIQHSIQGREDFAVGGNPDFGRVRPEDKAARLDEITNASRQVYEENRAKQASGVKTEDDMLLEELGLSTPASKPWEELTPREQLEWRDAGRFRVYNRLAGEVEARNVQKRMNMSADERRAAPPWETQDIPDADQIVRLYSNASKEGAIPALMNYDVPDVFYHGTPDASFSKFNIDEIRARAPEQNNGFAGVSMSPYPDEASGYASLRGAAPGMFPLRSDATNPFVWNVDDFYDGKMPKYQFGKLKGDEPATLQRLRGVIPDYKFRGGDFPSYGFGMSEALAAAGYDALDIVHGGKLSERAALAPNTVRSATTGETLFSNADSKPALLASGLDMGQEARLARAEKRYDTSMPWYHGTRAGGFDEFDPSLANSSSKTGVPDGAIVFSSSPENASTYAAFREDMFGDPKYGDGAAVMPVYLDKSTLDMVVDAKGAGWRDIEYNGQFYDANELAQIAKDLEYEGLLVRNVIDSKISHGAKPADTYFKFSPQGIRSVNAAFDPEKANSTNLLAANADSRPALLGSGQEQDIPDWLLPYLGR